MKGPPGRVYMVVWPPPIGASGAESADMSASDRDRAGASRNVHGYDSAVRVRGKCTINSNLRPQIQTLTSLNNLPQDMDKAALERRLSHVSGFRDPRVDLEQYPTPADLAAHLVHLADVQGDIAERTVVDLGTGTGMLALGAAFRRPARVLALDRDPAALAQARENERRVAGDEGTSATTAGASPTGVEWLLGDATRAPLCLSGVPEASSL